MSSYNSSYYNIWKRTEEGYIAYNTLHGSSVLLSGKEYNWLMNGEIDKFPEEDLQTLESLHMIGKDLTAAKEREILREYIEKERKNPSVMTFTIAPTYRCNLACTYCYQNESNIEMDEEDVEATINFIKNMTTLKGCKSLDLAITGGEPLLCPKTCFKILEEIKDWADKEGFAPQFLLDSPAGKLLSKEILTELKKYNLGAIHLTLDGPKRIHDQRRKYKDGKGTYDDIIKAIKMLEEEGVHTNVRINIDKDNVGHIDELFCDLEKENFSTFKNINLYLGFLVPCTRGIYVGKTHLAPQQSAKASLKIREKAKRRSLPMRPPHYGGKYRTSCPPCMAQLDKSFTIAPQGKIYQCPCWIGKEEFCSGHIDKYGNFEKSKTYFELRNRDPLTFDKCEKCKLLPICFGGCCDEAYYISHTFSFPACNLSVDGVLKSLEINRKTSCEAKGGNNE